MIKLERRLIVVCITTGGDLVQNEVEVVAENYNESVTFVTTLDNYPALGSNIVITIEEGS